MAIPDVIVVSSSPPRYPKNDCEGMSSSPGLPSLKALIRPKAGNGIGNIASSNSKGAQVSSLPSAVNLLWDVPDDHQHIAAGGAPENFGNKPMRVKVPWKPRVSKDANSKAEPSLVKLRKPRTAKSEGIEDEVAPKEKARRKPWAKKDTAEIQTKMPKPHVTKSSIGLRVDKCRRQRTTERVNSHFPPVLDPLADPSGSHKESSNGLLLQEAVKRRINWTPPKPTAELSDVVHIPNLDSTILSELTKTEHNIAGQLDLMVRFGRSNEDERPTMPKWAGSISPRKRKLIELVKTNARNISSPEKPKAAKKKPRTITELATSAYAIYDDEVTRSLSPAPLLQHFPPKDKTSIDSRSRIGTASNGLPKARSKSPIKASKASKASKPKKGTIEAPILLSPETALKRSAKQEFVFGTSSQLAREDSPTLLRDLQRAMQESNKIEDDRFADIEDWNSSTSSSATERGTDLYKAQRNLWGAASLGAEGEESLIMDLSRSPRVLEQAKPHSVSSCQSKIAPDSTVTVESDEWHELDEENGPEEKKVSTTVVPSMLVEPRQVQGNPASTSEDASTAPARREVSLLKLPAQPNKSRHECPIEQKPDYRSYVTAQLTKEIASYHFKPLKSRNQMIALLERCWEGRNRVALGNLGANDPLRSQATYSTKSDEKVDKITEVPKASRGRPRKDSTKQNPPARSKARAKLPKTLDKHISATAEAEKPLVLLQTPKKQRKRTTLPEEIYDSDTAITSSPPRRSVSKVRSPPPPLQVSPSPDESSTLLSPTAQQSRLHLHITRAITSAPPSTDPKNLTWHEKILLYDPIVLEDLTRWLNTGALQEVGWDEEVDPKEVKAWCLSKSICCLWRENLRGETRKRF